MTKTLKLSWLRFGFSCAALGIFPILLIASDFKKGKAWPEAAVLCLGYLSIVGFFSLGWARLRRANAIKPIPVSEPDLAIQLLIGPLVPAVIWFGCTILVSIAILVASAVLGHAA